MDSNVNENAAKVPEQEATAILKKLRTALPKVPLSVLGFVDKKNRRLIHIAADSPDGEQSTDLHYLADKGVGKIVTDAKKKITERFAL